VPPQIARAKVFPKLGHGRERFPVHHDVDDRGAVTCEGPPVNARSNSERVRTSVRRRRPRAAGHSAVVGVGEVIGLGMTAPWCGTSVRVFEDQAAVVEDEDDDRQPEGAPPSLAMSARWYPIPPSP